MKPIKLLILCTGNSCRSQIAQAYLQKLDPSLEVYSAGTQPAPEVHPLAIKVMEEAGYSLKNHYPKNVDQYIAKPFDYVITVCDDARETCPVFTGQVQHRFHFGFEDPAKATGTAEEKLSTFRRIRDEIFNQFEDFYTTTINKEQ